MSFCGVPYRLIWVRLDVNIRVVNDVERFPDRTLETPKAFGCCERTKSNLRRLNVAQKKTQPHSLF